MTTIQELIQSSIFDTLANDRIKCQCSERTFYRRNANRHMKCNRHDTFMRNRQVQLPPPSENIGRPVTRSQARREREVQLEEPCLTSMFRNAITIGNLQLVMFMVDELNCWTAQPIFTPSGKFTYPIIWAARCNRLEILQYFLTKEVDIDSLDINKGTAFSWACYNGHTEIAQFLVQQGADITIRDDKGKSGLDWARNKGYYDIVELLTLCQYESLIQECAICMDTKDQFWTCNQCNNQHCSTCHVKINNRKCPFCRHGF